MIFFFNDTATTEIYTLSLHDALPISGSLGADANSSRNSPPTVIADAIGKAVTAGRPKTRYAVGFAARPLIGLRRVLPDRDRKSTRLNSSHANISYAVFCLKKKKKTKH